MNSSQAYSELDLINILLTMCMPLSGPAQNNILFKEGYRIISIDRDVHIDGVTVKYDIVLSSSKKDITLCFELKGYKASNIEKEQFDKYKGISVEEFTRLSGIYSKNRHEHKLQTLIGINMENIPKVESFQVKKGYSFPILGFGSQEITVHFKKIEDEEVDEAFVNGFQIKQGYSKVIHFDKESTDLDIAHRMIAYIFSLAKRNQLSFTVDQAVEETYCTAKSLYKIIGPDVKKAVRSRMMKLLKKLSLEEFKEYIEWDTKERTWLIHKVGPDSHHQTNIAFRKASLKFLERLKSNAPFNKEEKVPPGQMSLDMFDELFMEENIFE